ncbi:MAG: hypothetical protein ACI4EJ_10065 [Bacteroides sp.]
MKDSTNDYLDTICSHIKWKNYQSAIRAELQSHIDESTIFMCKNGMSKQDALESTIRNMGNADDIGIQLNKAYTPKLNKPFILFVFFGIAIFALLQMTSIFSATHNWIYAIKPTINILIGLICSFVVFIFDWSSNTKINLFVTYSLIVTLTTCILIKNISFSDKSYAINAIFILIPSICCCITDRVKYKQSAGLIIVFIVFAIPLTVAYYVQAFSAIIVLSVCSWSMLIMFIQSGHLDITKKHIGYIAVSVPYICALIYMILFKIKRITADMNVFFIKHYIDAAVPFGHSNLQPIDIERLSSYPLTLLITEYGYIFLGLYLAFLVCLVCHVINIYKSQQSITGKLLVMSVIVSLVTEGIFSILLNVGIPLVYGITVPYIDLHYGIIAKLIQLGLIIKMDCFGNYIFSNYSDNRLFDFEGGKIIIYCK